MLIAAAIITILLIAGTVIYLQYFGKRRLIVSTTTSLYDTGLLDVIEKAFEARHPIDVNFIPVGTGVAIQNAKNGDADVTLVHSPKLERSFLEEGYGVCRKIIAYNFFAIVGPEADSAGIRGLNATEALKRIAAYGESQTQKTWVSRSDNSGTHQKEQSLWTASGYNYSEIKIKSWYARADTGMGGTLLMAEEFSAYTLTDMGTYLKYSKDDRISLKTLVTEGKEMLNVYSVIAVNHTRHPSVNFEDAITLIKFLVSEEGQQLIESHGASDYGQSLFLGAVQPLKQNSSQQVVQWIQDYSFFNGSECPPEYRDGHPELYS